MPLSPLLAHKHSTTTDPIHRFRSDALTEIFNHCDLDGNGYLSRQEFDVFQMRTSGESCDDDSWEVMVGG